SNPCPAEHCIPYNNYPDSPVSVHTACAQQLLHPASPILQTLLRFYPSLFLPQNHTGSVSKVRLLPDPYEYILFPSSAVSPLFQRLRRPEHTGVRRFQNHLGFSGRFLTEVVLGTDQGLAPFVDLFIAAVRLK